MTTITTDGAHVRIEPLPDNQYRISIETVDPKRFIALREWKTSYPPELIERVLSLKGPSYLCDEIARDESEEYTGAALKWALLSYISAHQFDDARVLDFGCGAGTSSIALCRMFPTAEVVGV
jgi:methylase of polypeptide subunit release factors